MAQKAAEGVWVERVPLAYRRENDWSAIMAMFKQKMPEREAFELERILEPKGVEAIRKTGLYVLDFDAMAAAPQNFEHDLEEFFVSESHLEQVRKVQVFDHAQGLELLNSLGEISTSQSDYYYRGDYLSWPGFLFPSAFWSEVLNLKRALWLLLNLGNPTTITERVHEESYRDGERFFKLSWPTELLHQRCKPMARPPMAFDPDFVGPLTLEGLINDGLSRTGVFNEIRFDPTTGGFERRPLGRSPGAALWELISRKTAGFKAPIKCQVCGALVEARRKTRKYCSPACCKQAQRLGISETRAAG